MKLKPNQGFFVKVPVAYRVDPWIDEEGGAVLSEFILQFRPRAIPSSWSNYTKHLLPQERLEKTNLLYKVISEENR